MEGDEKTGITIMCMEEGLDTGDMLAGASTPIGDKTAAQLHDELAVMGAGDGRDAEKGRSRRNMSGETG